MATKMEDRIDVSESSTVLLHNIQEVLNMPRLLNTYPPLITFI